MLSKSTQTFDKIVEFLWISTIISFDSLIKLFIEIFKISTNLNTNHGAFELKKKWVVSIFPARWLCDKRRKLKFYELFNCISVEERNKSV